MGVGLRVEVERVVLSGRPQFKAWTVRLDGKIRGLVGEHDGEYLAQYLDAEGKSQALPGTFKGSAGLAYAVGAIAGKTV